MYLELTSVSTKGQVVIPKSIRQKLGISSDSKLMVMTDGENILMKLVKPLHLDEFTDLINESRLVAEKQNLSFEDIKEVLNEVRSESRC
jgi:AbrB family looped-hinge helix DNA binding protein